MRAKSWSIWLSTALEIIESQGQKPMMTLITSKFQDHVASPWVMVFALAASTCEKTPLIYHPIRLRMGVRGVP